jgi:DNA-binding transcriptional LysR family regulator
MNSPLQTADLRFLSVLASSASLSSAAIELGVTKAAVSKRLALMEDRLGVVLVNRSTRRMSLTPEGESAAERARDILGDIDELGQWLDQSRLEPKGLLRVNATLGFGRGHVAPLISKFVRSHPKMSVQLQLSVNPPALGDDAFDVCIRFGEPPDARVIATRLAPNRRLLCASPDYLAKHGEPQTPAELREHSCIGIRQGDEAYGNWRLTLGTGSKRKTEVIKTRGPLSTNDGEIAVRWALDGHGVLMRAEWDIAGHLQSGRLRQVLSQWKTPDADIYAVVPQRLQWSPRTRPFVQFLSRAFAQALPGSEVR